MLLTHFSAHRDGSNQSLHLYDNNILGYIIILRLIKKIKIHNDLRIWCLYMTWIVHLRAVIYL